MDLGKRFSEIQCPICKERFTAKKGKPRTLKQWRVSLFTHLIAKPEHQLKREEAESVITKYFKLLEG
jgi:hypothetical protein